MRIGHVCICYSGIAILKHSFWYNDALGFGSQQEFSKPQKSYSLIFKMLLCGAYLETASVLENSLYITPTPV